jgi:dTMP kinase
MSIGSVVDADRQQGLVVALTGIDGAGKSSVHRALAAETSLGGAAFVAKSDRSNVEAVERRFRAHADRGAANLSGWYAQAIRWAHAFDFLNLYASEVEPALEQDRVVVADRWATCSVAYAATGTTIDADVERVLAGCRAPDLIVHIEVDPEEAYRRIARRGVVKGDEDLAVLRTFAAAYDRVLDRLAGPPVVRVRNDHLPATVAAVRDAVLGIDGVASRLTGVPGAPRSGDTVRVTELGTPFTVSRQAYDDAIRPFVRVVDVMLGYLSPPAARVLVDLWTALETGAELRVPDAFERHSDLHRAYRELRHSLLLRPAVGGQWDAGKRIELAELAHIVARLRRDVVVACADPVTVVDWHATPRT